MSRHENRSSGTTPTPHRPGAAVIGKMLPTSSRGLTVQAWERGWLPRRAAAAAMGLTFRELDAAVRAGVIGRLVIGPNCHLYQVVLG